MGKKSTKFYLIIGLIALCLLLIVYFGWVEYAKYASKKTSPGTFGDQFGGLNALFTGWAFALLILTLIVQMIELRNQRKEIEGQKIALERQNATLQFQQFEDRFFNMLRIHHEIKNNIKIHQVEGTRVFTVLAYELGLLYKAFSSDILPPDHELRSLMARYGIKETDWLKERKRAGNNDREILRIAYKYLFNLYHYEIGHYFRNIYNTIRLVKARRQIAFDNLHALQLDKIEVDREETKIMEKYKEYANMVQAQMSSAELTIMFYNGLFFPKMKELINDFKFIDNLPLEDIILDKHKDYYDFDFKTRSEIFG